MSITADFLKPLRDEAQLLPLLHSLGSPADF